MFRRLVWILDTIKSDGLFQTLLYLKNTLYLHYVKTIKRQKFLQKKVHGLRMYLNVEDPGISRTLAIKGTREQDQIQIVRQELQEGMTVLDVGANIGMYALLEAHLVGPKGRVFAIEPSPENFDLLNKNIALNNFEDRIQTFQLGASNKAGTSTFFLHNASNLHTFHPTKYREFSTRSPESQYNNTIEVEVVNITDFTRNKAPIDFVRMDIEGFEVEVFEGMEQGLMEGWLSPKILFECHRPKYDDIHHSMRARLNRLFELGYYPKTLISTDESIAQFKNKGYTPQKQIKTDGVWRGLYNDIIPEDATEFICDIGFVRAVLLDKK